MEGRQERPNAGNQRTGRLISNRWEEARKSDAHPLDTWQAARMGHHHYRYLCPVSYRRNSREQTGAAATNAAIKKTTKYACLTTMHHFVPIAIETGGPWNIEAIEFVIDLGKMITQVTLEPLETQYLFQRFSITLQRGNEIAFRNTFKNESAEYEDDKRWRNNVDICGRSYYGRRIIHADERVMHHRIDETQRRRRMP